MTCFWGGETKRMRLLSIFVLVAVAAVFAMIMRTRAYADPPHCDRTGYPLCYITLQGGYETITNCCLIFANVK